MLSLLCALSWGETSFEQAMNHVQNGEIAKAEEMYYSLLSTPDAGVYRALGLLLSHKDATSVCAHVALIRAQNLEVFPSKIQGEHTLPSFVWLWLGVVLCYVGWIVFPKHLGKAIFVGLAVAMLALFPFFRYKGSVVDDDVMVLHAPYAQGVSLTSLSQGDVVQLLGRESEFWNISFGQTKGWVHEKSVVSWDPYDTFDCFH